MLNTGGTFALVPAALLALSLGMRVSVAQSVEIPFVGCKADGMSGPVTEPTGHAVIVPGTLTVLTQLAYYGVTPQLGTFAPKGWSCACLYDSSGSYLFVSPKPMTTEQIAAERDTPIVGPLVRLMAFNGWTSGRDLAAPVIARYFPRYMSYVKGVESEHDTPTHFAVRPYKADVITYKNQRSLSYVTHAQQAGLGSYPYENSNHYATYGLVRFDKEVESLQVLSVMLTPEQTALSKAIVQVALNEQEGKQ